MFFIVLSYTSGRLFHEPLWNIEAHLKAGNPLNKKTDSYTGCLFTGTHISNVKIVSGLLCLSCKLTMAE